MDPWVLHELASLDLGDKRRDDRCRLLLHQLGDRPSLSLPAATGSHAAMTAAYRFFDNDAVEDEDILAAHRDAVVQRCGGEGVVLVPQDTTELDFTRPKETLGGPRSSTWRRGFSLHACLALAPDRRCLGVVDYDLWARDEDGFGGKRQRKTRPLAEKESRKWLDGLAATRRFAARLPKGTTVVAVADAESDVYEFLVEAVAAAADRQAPGAQVRFVIRAGQDRAVQTPAGTRASLRAVVAARPPLGEVAVDVAAKDDPKRGPRQARTARLEVRAATVALAPPWRPAGVKLSPLTVHVVQLAERDPPASEDPIAWVLLTDRKVRTLQQAVELAGWYAARWQIELWFKTLKSGLRIEARQLESEARLRPCLALSAIVAWRVLDVTMQARATPDASCELVFTPTEWRAVWQVSRRVKPPADPPPLKTMLELVAKLGGWLGRKHDGPPGIKSVWQGLQRMQDFAQALLAYQTLAAR